MNVPDAKNALAMALVIILCYVLATISSSRLKKHNFANITSLQRSALVASLLLERSPHRGSLSKIVGENVKVASPHSFYASPYGRCQTLAVDSESLPGGDDFGQCRRQQSGTCYIFASAYVIRILYDDRCMDTIGEWPDILMGTARPDDDIVEFMGTGELFHRFAKQMQSSVRDLSLREFSPDLLTPHDALDGGPVLLPFLAALNRLGASITINAVGLPGVFGAVINRSLAMQNVLCATYRFCGVMHAVWSMRPSLRTYHAVPEESWLVGSCGMVSVMLDHARGHTICWFRDANHTLWILDPMQGVSFPMDLYFQEINAGNRVVEVIGIEQIDADGIMEGGGVSFMPSTPSRTSLARMRTIAPGRFATSTTTPVKTDAIAMNKLLAVCEGMIGTSHPVVQPLSHQMDQLGKVVVENMAGVETS